MTWQGDLYQFCSTKVHTSGNLSFCFKKQIDYWSNDMQYLSLPPQGFDSIFNFFFERICPTMCIWLHWDGLFSWIRKECYNISRKQQNFSDTVARPKSKSCISRLNSCTNLSKQNQYYEDHKDYNLSSFYLMFSIMPQV